MSVEPAMDTRIAPSLAAPAAHQRDPAKPGLGTTEQSETGTAADPPVAPLSALTPARSPEHTAIFARKMAEALVGYRAVAEARRQRPPARAILRQGPVGSRGRVGQYGRVMDLIVFRGDGRWLARFGESVYRCALGAGGCRLDKREGDGATPVGTWPMRRVLHRPDRLAPPATALPVAPLGPDDGWCDDPGDPRYNRPVTLPYAASHEALWRDDETYDVIVVLGHNDGPPLPGRGSAIFLHVARPDYPPTKGCLALALSDLLAVLRGCGPGGAVAIPGT